MNQLENHSESRPASPEQQIVGIAPPPLNFSALAQPSYARTLFLGPQGLRPGWGFAFYVVMFYTLQRFAGNCVDLFHVHGLWAMMLGEFAVLVAAVIPSLILARVEHRAWGVYGLPGPQAFGKFFWIGALWGFAGITLLLASLHGLHAFDFGYLALHGIRIAKFAAFWALMFLLVGFFEEFMLRGYAQFALTRGIGFWPAALVLSAIFGLIHLNNDSESWPGVTAAATIGFFFCLTLRRTGSLWFAVGFHAAWDWGETFFYSVPDSGTIFPGHLLRSSFHGARWLTGGEVGPEGSVVCFVVIAVLWIAFDRLYPEAKYSPV
jgi:uncharacterized protein